MPNCKICSATFNPNDLYKGFGPKRSLYCSDKCMLVARARSWKVDAAKLNGNWERYFRRIIQKKKVLHKAVVSVTAEELIGLYEKQGKRCALTGRELQCRVLPGVPSPENASLDRIVAGGPYSVTNIQLVCRDVNGFRGDTPLKNFIHVCALVAAHAAKKNA